MAIQGLGTHAIMAGLSVGTTFACQPCTNSSVLFLFENGDRVFIVTHSTAILSLSP